MAWSLTIRLTMKTFVIFATIAQLLFGSVAFTSTITPDAEASVSIKDDLFILKTSRKFKGADVELVAPNGFLVSSQKLVYRKMVIDFQKMPSGTYKVRLRKNQMEKEFTFQKETTGKNL
ncbi:MAG: hypothetical protein ING88_09045 [Cytophagales bacterium]|jgi:hypothetical protein|nr:hypothetical protein [Cytophagales bacterium]